MNEQFPQFYEFGEFRLDASKRLLRRNDETVPLMPKAFDVLLTLVQNRGQVITKDDLMKRVWHDTVVEENSLNVNVSALRKIFGEKPKEHRFIVTVPGVGYEFVADVREVWNEPIVSEPPAVAGGSEDLGLQNADFGLSFGQTAIPPSQIHNPQSKSPPANAGGSDLLPKSRSFKRPVLFTIGAIVILIVSGFGLSRWWSSPTVKQENHPPFQTIQLTKLTSGKALQVAISPDGKQVAYVLEEPEGQSLWLRQTAIDSSVRLVPPQQISYLSVVFGSDGDFIYYATTELSPKPPNGTLYEIPVLGGIPRKLLEKIISPATLAHDGKRLAFFRFDDEKKTIRLFVADTDGADETLIAQPELWRNFMPPVWSPDDSRVARLMLDPGNKTGKISAVRLSDGETQDLTVREWKQTDGAVWTSNGLFVAAQERDEDWFQLWHINPATGETRKLTNDLHDYSGVSLTADGRTLATIQIVTLMNVWTVSLSESHEVKQITSGANMYFDISFTPDGKLLYSSRTGGHGDIWQMDADGANRRQLTKNAGSNYGPAASPDGRFLFFQSNRSGAYRLYRTRADGGDPQRLTDEELEETAADCTPDGKAVIFNNYTTAAFSLKRVSVEGGTSILLNDKFNIAPVVSPDGKLIAVWHVEKPSDPPSLALIPLETGGVPIKTFTVPPTAVTGWAGRVRWTLDGRGLFFIDTRDGVSNIWRQPIDGSAPTQITDFKTERIFSFAVSPDGKQLAIVRGTIAQDVVLLSDKQ